MPAGLTCNLSYTLPAHQDDFDYLNQGDSPYVNGVDDADSFEETREAMYMLGITEDEQHMIFRILAGILHLGNVDIEDAAEEESTIKVVLYQHWFMLVKLLPSPGAWCVVWPIRPHCLQMEHLKQNQAVIISCIANSLSTI